MTIANRDLIWQNEDAYVIAPFGLLFLLIRMLVRRMKNK